jgi:hypothetical protein
LVSAFRAELELHPITRATVRDSSHQYRHLVGIARTRVTQQDITPMDQTLLNFIEYPNCHSDTGRNILKSYTIFTLSKFNRLKQCLIYVILNFSYRVYLSIRSRVSSVSIESGYGLDNRAIEVRSPAETKLFPLASVTRPDLGPTQPPVQWVPGSFPRG